MALKRMVLQIGMGTDIRGADYTKAAVRALRDALWHNSLSVATALGLPVDAMQVEVTIGVPRPERVDKAAVLAVLPHGTGTVEVVEGGLEITNDEGTNTTVLANAAAIVRLDVPEAQPMGSARS
ncbi:MAG: Lin0512 family protein [Alphaproteobacteria bacterium]